MVKMNHYTYILKGEISYIGVRSCKCEIDKDNYWGSSKHLPKNINETHEKIILGKFLTREEAIKNEIYLHNKYDVAKNPLFYNQSKQTSTGWNTAGTKASEETRLKLLGRIYSEETRLKRSKSMLGKNKGKNNGMFGKPLSLEHKKKQSLSLLGKPGPRHNDEIKNRIRLKLKEKWKDKEFREKTSNSLRDNKIYSFIHESGIKRNSTKKKLIEEFNLNACNLCWLCLNKRKTHKGWKLFNN